MVECSKRRGDGCFVGDLVFGCNHTVLIMWVGPGRLFWTMITYYDSFFMMEHRNNKIIKALYKEDVPCHCVLSMTFALLIALLI